MNAIIDAIQIFIFCACLIIFPISAVVCTLSDDPQLSYFLVMFTGIVGVLNALIMFDRNS
jgi:uncharacterized membrane protein HdeD (DUF308 family)